MEVQATIHHSGTHWLRVTQLHSAGAAFPTMEIVPDIILVSSRYAQNISEHFVVFEMSRTVSSHEAQGL